MELRIDNTLCDTPCGMTLSQLWDSASMCSAEALREGWRITLTLPSSPTNDALFGQGVPHGEQRFNFSIHSATLGPVGQPLLSGIARLKCCKRSGSGTRSYEIELRGGAAEWAQVAATHGLDELPVAWEGRLLPTEICAGWSGEQVVRFLPLSYDDYRPTYSSESLTPCQQILSTDDYHPFLHLHTLIETIFTQCGYHVESRFMESEFFRSLYLSGAYARRDTSGQRRRMDFLARRSADTTSTANYSGRVYASPFVAEHSVGNVVDCFTARSDDGEPSLDDCFNTNATLTLEEGELVCRPVTEVELGFEYALSYTTDYRIASRTRLTGFDSVCLGTGADFRFELANPFADRREALTAGQSYRLLLFDWNEGNEYQLRTAAGAEVATTAERSTLITWPQESETSGATLWVRSGADAEWVLCTGDWALYDGYVEERGSTDVSFTLRTAPETVGPTQPKRFRHIYFYGAEPDMGFTLKRGSSLRPCFSARPGYGSTLGWSDVTHHGIRQSELLDAVIHLFNWRIFTDEAQRKVCIEPAAEFYAQDQPVDWSHKQLTATESVLIESDLEQHASRRYGYRDEDGCVRRWNNETGSRFGEWQALSPSMATLQGEEALLNPLLAPTLNHTGVVGRAPSASVPIVGDRDDSEAAENFQFTPRLVRYLGQHTLPAGECWGSPAPEGCYPLAAFHFAGDEQFEGFTLCFEDRDGLQGLHRFYDQEEAVLARGRRLTLSLWLPPEEVEALQHRSTEEQAGPDALFRLRIDGEAVRGRLDALEHYDFASQTARCRFTLLPDDRP